MQRAKTFFYVAAGIFLLALSYHLGAKNAVAQAPGNPVVAAGDCTIYTANGDMYWRSGCGPSPPQTCMYLGNVFGGPVPTTPQSFGQVKTKYLGRTPDAGRLDVQRAHRDGR